MQAAGGRGGHFVRLELSGEIMDIGGAASRRPSGAAPHCEPVDALIGTRRICRKPWHRRSDVAGPQVEVRSRHVFSTLSTASSRSFPTIKLVQRRFAKYIPRIGTLGRGFVAGWQAVMVSRRCSSMCWIASAAATIRGRADLRMLTGRAPDEALRMGWAHGALLTTYHGDITIATIAE